MAGTARWPNDETAADPLVGVMQALAAVAGATRNECLDAAAALASLTRRLAVEVERRSWR